MNSLPVNGMRPIHPGEILREEFLAPLNLSANALAIAIAVPAPRVNEIVRERRAISPDTALRLAKYFGNSPEFWLGLQMDFDLASTKKSLKGLLARIAPRAAA